MTLIILRYGEIGLKSRNVRTRWQGTLLSNITDYFLKEGVEFIHSSEWGRMYIETPEPEAAITILRRIFGIVSLSPAIQTTAAIHDIKECIVNYAADHIRKQETFCVRARRTGTHDFTSKDLEVEMGSAVLDTKPGLKVNLTRPDITIYVEVRGKRAYIFHEKIRGPGGLPLGTQGRVLAHVHDPPSAVAAWLMMKRGCKTHILGNESEYTSALEKWDIHLKVHWPHSDGASIIRKHRIEAIVKGTVIDGFEVESAQHALPVFYPVIGLDETEIQRYWHQIA